MADENDKQNGAEPVPQEELEKCRKERDEYLAGWQRAKADFINYKKDEMRRIEELARYQNEDIILDLITVMDNFDLTLEVLAKFKEAPTSAGGDGVGVPTPKAVGMEKGIYMIRTQIEDLLRQRGLSRIELKPGDPYDPAIAEAVAEGEGEHPPGSVLEIVEVGYKLFDKVIRPARVKVVKHE